MINPVNNVDKIYFLVDGVHLLESVRHNWITLKNTHKTFTFPDIEDNTVTLHASFDHLKVVYNTEVNSTLKQAFKLTLKSLFSHSIERQNVRQACSTCELDRHFHIYISYSKVVGYAEYQIIW